MSAKKWFLFLGFWGFAIFSGTPTGISSAQEAGGTVPAKYVGKWAGIAGMGWSNSSEQVGTAAVVTQFGHTIDNFKFEVADDGSLNGSGTATYTYSVKVDAHLIAAKKAANVEIEGKSQKVEFNISGKITPDGKLQLKATPRSLLKLVGGKEPTMEAWNVFAGLEGTAEMQNKRLIVDTFGAAAINGKTAKIGWAAKKKPSRGVNIYVDAFIPSARIKAPPLSGFHELAGDDRGFHIGGRPARLWSQVIVDLDDDDPLVFRDHGVGESHGYRKEKVKEKDPKDPTKFITSEVEVRESATADPTWNGTRGMRETAVRNGNSVVVKIDAKVGLPLVKQAPEIDYHYTITLTPRGEDVEYKITGNHDGFPAYSIWLETALVHKHFPLDTGQTELSLYGSGEFSVNESGTIPCGAVPAGGPSTIVPGMFVGKWTAGLGKGVSVNKVVQKRATVIKDLGHIIDKFEFDVAKDGTVTGTGAATYWFDISSDIDAVEIKKSPDAHLVGNLQKIDFTITGEMTGDGKLRLNAEPRKELMVIHSLEKKGPIGAWNVFGGVQGSVERGADGLVVRGVDLVDPAGLKMKLDWKAKKKLKLLDITSLVLNDIDDVKLEYLSSAAHTYFSGNTRIHGTITIVGPKDEKLESLALEVVQNGNVVAIAKLTAGLSSTLIGVPFGADEKLEIKTSQLLFDLPSAEAAKVDGSQNGKLLLRAKARSSDGQETTKDFGEVEILVRYTNTNRYGAATRDGHRGGDDWLKPSVKLVIEHFPDFTWNDFSNMNAGSFATDHSTHKTGNDADGWYDGFNARDAATAQKLIDCLNDDTYGSRITRVYVTFTPAFKKAIKDVVLDSGKMATEIFNDEAEHDTHFHFVISDQ